MLKWLYRFGSPKLFYQLTDSGIRWMALICASLFFIGIVWALLLAPPDYQMGDSYRIIYIHVPSAGLMQGCYYLMALMSFTYLIWGIKMADIVAQACAPIGATAAALMLISGSLWGVPTWGTFWAWDARLTSSLLMFFIYIGIISLRSSYESKESGSKLCAMLTLVGLINIPIIQFSVEWWNTLHQPSSQLSLRNTAANPPEIWVPAFILGFAMIAFFFLVLTLRVRNEILWRERRTQWVRQHLLGGDDNA
ncbi:MAG: heme ABC transporter permease [SAR86 cluster bacterium]|uniref:Heme exporter protein C n=1 Tax=SAR86 cluster bacterium TaxID=2030880 RepID=A0A2A4MQM8_9GAMM|nr:MAG: heme ABC transporter permease [SAR86 cluster bacterium]